MEPNQFEQLPCPGKIRPHYFFRQSNCFCGETTRYITADIHHHQLSQPLQPDDSDQLSNPPLQRGNERGIYVTLKVYDLLGREVATLVNERKDAGTYSVQWNASGFATGMYLVRIQARPTNGGQAGSFVDTKKVLLMK